jgi:hypothetical protein
MLITILKILLLPSLLVVPLLLPIMLDYFIELWLDLLIPLKCVELMYLMLKTQKV